MLGIEIAEKVETEADMVDLLRRIADMIENPGFTSGHYPTWRLTGEAEEPDNDEEE